MKNRNYLTCILLTAAFSLFPMNAIIASPLLANFTPTTGHCDDPTAIQLTDELGSGQFFQPLTDELISVQVTPFLPQTACVADDVLQNDWLVTMTNLGNVDYEHLYFVADDGIAIGNFDGTVTDVPGLNLSLDAFRIDGPVTFGQNNPLLFDNDEIFSPGEIWEFFVVNFDEPNQLPPRFGSIGLSGLSPNDFASNASIIAIPVPEPGNGTLLSCALFALLGAGRRVAC